jgi:hypothetical protein
MLSPTTFAILLPLFFITHILYTYIRNPLRKIPAAHPLAHFTSLWIHSVRWRSIENATFKAAHARLGPIICLGPNEISVNCVKGGIREVYAGGFEKTNGRHNWYSFFANYGGYVILIPKQVDVVIIDCEVEWTICFLRETINRILCARG